MKQTAAMVKNRRFSPDIAAAMQIYAFAFKPDGEVPQNFARHRCSDADIWAQRQSEVWFI